jgi:hypothetical protein
MSIKIPIVSDFDGRGVKLAVAEFKSLEKVSDKAQFAIRKAAVPAAAAIGGLGTAAFKAAQKASDLNEEISKSEVIFGNASKDVIAFSKTAATEIGQSQRSALEASGTFGVLGKAAGLTGTELGQFSTKFTTLASDLASFNNTTPEDAIQAIGAALRGEAEPIRRYGVLLNDATLRQKALALGLISTTKEALTPQNKTLAAQAVILEQTKDAQGDFARTSDGLANQQRILKARVEDATAALGKAFLPILEQIIPILSSLADFVGDNTGLIGGLTIALGLFAGAIVAARIALAVWKGVAVITAGINWALAASFTAVQVSTGIGIATALAGAAAFVVIQKKMKNARAAAEGFKGSLTGVSGETGKLKNLIDASSKVTETDTDATDTATAAAEKLAKAKEKAAAAAKKAADAAKKLADSVKQAKDELDEAVKTLRDQFNTALDNAKTKLKAAQEAFDDYASSVSDSISNAFSFGTAQKDASDNAQNLTDAIQDQQKAQEALNKALKGDDIEAITEAQKGLAEATQKVVNAQKKPMTFFESLTKEAAKAKKFGELVNRLIAGDLSEAALQQVLAAGVDAGTLIAEEILGSADGILRANELVKDVQDLADRVGQNAASKYYAAGVVAGTALVNGVQSVIDQYEVRLNIPGITAADVAGMSGSFASGGAAGVLTMPDPITQTTAFNDWVTNTLGNIGDLGFLDLNLGNIMGHVPMFANGGIVTSPTLGIIGEAGPEAVIPLDRLGGMGGGMNITVNAGLVSTPDQIGQEIIQAIQKAQRRSGPVFAPA